MRTSLRRFSRSGPALIAVAATLAAGPSGHATAAYAVGTPVAVMARTCGAGYTHAVIGGQQKCLRRGEFCAHRYNAQYRRYGYSCTKRDERGNYHLT